MNRPYICTNCILNIVVIDKKYNAKYILHDMKKTLRKGLIRLRLPRIFDDFLLHIYLYNYIVLFVDYWRVLKQPSK